MVLCGLDWNALTASVFMDWILSAGRVKRSVVAPTDHEQGSVSDRADLYIQAIAAGLSQCLIGDILNDVMWSGLECSDSQCVHGLDFECREGEKISCCPN
eukprot:scaffold55_cov69-Cyclotella_meneghiniana.AAC.1